MRCARFFNLENFLKHNLLVLNVKRQLFDQIKSLLNRSLIHFPSRSFLQSDTVKHLLDQLRVLSYDPPWRLFIQLLLINSFDPYRRNVIHINQIVVYLRVQLSIIRVDPELTASHLECFPNLDD